MTTRPPPLIEIAVEAASKTDEKKLARALAQLAAEDESLRVQTDAGSGSGRTVLKGTGEPHLESVVDRLSQEFRIATRVGAPQVLYRETIGRPAQVDYTHKKLMQNAGQFARVLMLFEPLPPDTGVAFVNAVASGELPERYLPERYLPAIEAAVRACLANGVLAGFPVTDLRVTLTDGAWHETDSSLLAFDIATRAAVREGLANAAPKILEPVMQVEVITPPDCLGSIIGDLNSRRARITGQSRRGSVDVIAALAPLASMFDYAMSLKSLSRAQATFAMTFSHFAPIPSQE